MNLLQLLLISSIIGTALGQVCPAADAYGTNNNVRGGAPLITYPGVYKNLTLCTRDLDDYYRIIVVEPFILEILLEVPQRTTGDLDLYLYASNPNREAANSATVPFDELNTNEYMAFAVEPAYSPYFVNAYAAKRLPNFQSYTLTLRTRPGPLCATDGYPVIYNVSGENAFDITPQLPLQSVPLTICGDSKDLFKIVVTEPSTSLSVEYTSTDPYLDVDAYLYNSPIIDDANIIASSDSPGANEGFIANNLGPGTYYLSLSEYHLWAGGYSLSVSLKSLTTVPSSTVEPSTADTTPTPSTTEVTPVTTSVTTPATTQSTIVTSTVGTDGSTASNTVIVTPPSTTASSQKTETATFDTETSVTPTEDNIVAPPNEKSKSGTSGGVIAIAVVVPLVALLACCLIAAVLLVRKKKQKKKPEADFENASIASARSVHSEIGLSVMGRNFEIEYSQLTEWQLVGKGSFGSVFRCKWRENYVAVKQLHNFDEKATDDFRQEAAIITALRPHPNVVLFMGITLPPHPVSLVSEYCSNGSLQTFLHSNAKITTSLQKKILGGIAKGMYHLHSEAVIHRDLASRNILLTEHYEAKVSDFGMSRQKTADTTNSNTQSDVGPIKWMAPEAMQDHVYSIKTDVYSFGIVIWEMVARSLPYPDLPNVKVAIGVCKDGLRPTIPENCDPQLAELMKSCWDAVPENRPNFQQICSVLEVSSSKPGSPAVSAFNSLESIQSSNGSGSGTDSTYAFSPRKKSFYETLPKKEEEKEPYNN